MRAKGFTLIEVLFAMAILGIGGTSLVALFAYNLQLAKRAREEVVINVIQRDVSVRNQIAAFTRGVSDFATDSSWLVVDKVAYNTMATADRTWEDIPAYKGYSFWVTELRRQGSAWGLPDSTSSTYGLELYDAQFVDWDGYGWIDLDGDGQKDAGETFNAPDGSSSPWPSHRVRYDSRAMANYVKRLKGVVAWDLIADVDNDPALPNPEAKLNAVIDNNLGKYHVFYFTIYNPDTHKF